MKRLIYVFVIAVFFLEVLPGAAQTRRVAEAIEKIPVNGKVREDFVPSGWEIRIDADGDLNGDRISDVVIVLAPPFERVAAHEHAPNILVVLFGKPGGGFRRFAVNGQLHPPDADARSGLSPMIKNGVLRVNDNWGDGWVKDINYKFRYDPAVGKLMLIGFDSESYNRMDINSGGKSSENYLTGVRTVYSKTAGGGSDPYVESGRSKIKLAKVTFEAARYFEEEGGQVRPF